MSDETVLGPVTTELAMLGLAIALGLIQIVWTAIAARRQQGLEWARGARDEPRPVSGAAARLERALANFMETFPFFAAAVLMVLVTDTRGALSEWGSILYVVGRAAHLPLYRYGVPTVRTLAFAVATTGLILVALEPFV